MGGDSNNRKGVRILTRHLPMRTQRKQEKKEKQVGLVEIVGEFAFRHVIVKRRMDAATRV